MTEALRLFCWPVLFFRGVADSDIDWLRAVLPLALYVGGASVVVAGQAEGAMLVIALIVSVMSSFVGTLVVFWCYVGVVVAFDVFFSFSQRYRKLIECVALAHWPVGVWSCVVAVGAVGWFLSGGISPDDLESRVVSVAQGIGSTAFLCVCALCDAVSRAVSGASVGVSVSLAVVLAVLFVLGPWALGFL